MKTASWLVPPLMLAAIGASSSATPQLRFETYALALDDGSTIDAERGRLVVPENRARPERKIALTFVRLRAPGKQPGDPIVYLAGGPGDSGIGGARVPGLGALFQQLRGLGDVILIDQRGTGQSTPGLACAREGPLASDVFESAAAMRAALEPAARACADRLRKDGIDLGAYTTEASADDLDDLRAALRAPRITLLAFSYGTHLALAAVRRHGDRLGRVVLAGTEGPDHTHKLPSTFDHQVRSLSALVARHPAVARDVPDMARLLEGLLQRLERDPLTVTLTNIQGAPRSIRIGAWGLQYLLRRDIGDTNDLPHFPRLLHEISRGELGMLTRLAERRFTQLASGMSMMAIAMDCASGVSPWRAAQIASEVPGSLFGAMTNFPFPEVCDALGLAPLGAHFRAPLASTVSALFISGTLDANTPPFQAEELRWGFPFSTHLIVEGAGHESTLPHPDVQKAVLDFLRGEDVRGRRATLPLKFVPVW